jgi:hypothetical protein
VQFCNTNSCALWGGCSEKFFEAVLQPAQGAVLLGGEHFTVDGTLIAAWLSFLGADL